MIGQAWNPGGELGEETRGGVLSCARDTVEGVVEGRGRGGGGKKKVVVEAHKFSLGWFGVVCGALGFGGSPPFFGLSPAPTFLFF